MRGRDSLTGLVADEDGLVDSGDGFMKVQCGNCSRVLTLPSGMVAKEVQYDGFFVGKNGSIYCNKNHSKLYPDFD
ncbi:MAG: hypothetical protein ABIH37_00370 [archaeon]